jgi:hypothetical protein
MKIAYIINGLVGGLKGKNMDRNDDVHVPLITKYCKKTIDDFISNSASVDYYIFTWHTNHLDSFREIYQPKVILGEDQITFNIPSCANQDKRSQAHVSRWYGYNKIFKEFETFVEKEDIKYDYILNARFDICWNRPIVFNDLSKITLCSYASELDVESKKNLKFNLDDWPPRGKDSYHFNDVPDHIFGGDFEFMKNMSSIYDNIWTLHGQKKYGRNTIMSHHKLIPGHVRDLGKKNSDVNYLFHFNEGSKGPNKLDYDIFRYRNLTAQEISNI